MNIKEAENDKQEMGLFDFFGKKKSNSNKPDESKKEGAYLGDLAKTDLLSRLFKLPNEKREDDWTKAFLVNIIDASMSCGNPQVVNGPDGYPYFQLNTPEPNQKFQCYVLKHMINDFILEKGIGVVINSNKSQPDWVFSYGDLVNFYLNNEFYSKAMGWNMPKNEIIEENEEVLIGQPSEKYLPKPARIVLSNFFNQLEIRDVKLLLMNRKRTEGVLQELVFNLTPKRFEDLSHYESIMKSIAWFLPRHYRYVGMEENLFESQFEMI